MNVSITIDGEFASLVQPLSADELRLLTEQILRDGCRESLAVWKVDDKRILLDGHNRYKICSENRLDYQTIVIHKLESRAQAKLWILEHQIGRRNLTDDQRATMWNDIREQRSVVARAKQLQEARDAKAGSVLVKTADTAKSDTRAAIAKESQLPENKLRSAQSLKKINPELYSKVKAGTVTLKAAKALTPTQKTRLLIPNTLAAGSDRFGTCVITTKNIEDTRCLSMASHRLHYCQEKVQVLMQLQDDPKLGVRIQKVLRIYESMFKQFAEFMLDGVAAIKRSGRQTAKPVKPKPKRRAS